MRISLVPLLAFLSVSIPVHAQTSGNADAAK